MARKNRRFKRNPAIVRGRVRRGALVRLPRTSGVQQQKMVKMKYSTFQIGSSTTTALGLHQFRINSIFDPDFTAAGHQPLTHDQWATFYSNYRVVAVSIVVNAQSITSSATSRICISVGTGSQPTTICLMNEQRLVKTGFTTTEKNLTLRLFLPAHVGLGVTKAHYMNDDGFGSVFGDNPITNGFINVSWQNVDESTATGHTITADLTYWVLLSVPHTLGQS